MRAIPPPFRRRARGHSSAVDCLGISPSATGGRWRRPAVQGDRAHARQRPEGDRRADRVSEPRQHPDPGADRVAQRGRAGQVGLRAFLRAPDVPRHAGHPAAEVPRDHEQGRRARQRRAPATTPRTTTPRSPRRTLETILAPVRRHVPAPRVLRSGLQDRGARDSRRVQQEQRRSARRSCSRCSASASSRRTPTSTRRWGSSPTSRTCRTSTRTRRCSSSAGTARSTRPSSSPAT